MRGWRYEGWRHGLAARGLRTSYFAKRYSGVAAERFDPQDVRKIGEGSDRLAFAVGEERVLKVAKNPRGLSQNLAEGKEAPLTPAVVERGKDYVVVRSTTDTDRARVWKKIRGLRKYDSKDFDQRNPELVADLKRLGIEELLEKPHVAWGDIVKPSSWTIHDGRLKLVDAGALTTDSVVRHKVFDKEHPEKVREWHEVLKEREAVVEAKR